MVDDVIIYLFCESGKSIAVLRISAIESNSSCTWRSQCRAIEAPLAVRSCQEKIWWFRARCFNGFFPYWRCHRNVNFSVYRPWHGRSKQTHKRNNNDGARRKLELHCNWLLESDKRREETWTNLKRWNVDDHHWFYDSKGKMFHFWDFGKCGI